jgi:hypothetical protein
MLHELWYVGLISVPMNDLLWDELGPIPEVDMSVLVTAVGIQYKAVRPARYTPATAMAP